MANLLSSSPSGKLTAFSVCWVNQNQQWDRVLKVHEPVTPHHACALVRVSLRAAPERAEICPQKERRQECGFVCQKAAQASRKSAVRGAHCSFRTPAAASERTYPRVELKLSLAAHVYRLADGGRAAHSGGGASHFCVGLSINLPRSQQTRQGDAHVVAYCVRLADVRAIFLVSRKSGSHVLFLVDKTHALFISLRWRECLNLSVVAHSTDWMTFTDKFPCYCVRFCVILCFIASTLLALYSINNEHDALVCDWKNIECCALCYY